MSDEISGVNAETGQPLAGWPYVVQCAGKILTTAHFSRVMRPHVGSLVPALLGRLANDRNIQRFRLGVCLALLLWVPNFRPTRVAPLSLDATGAAGWAVDGIYYPRGHRGDWTDGEARSLALDGGAGTVTDILT